MFGLFKKKKEETPSAVGIDYSGLGVDMHSHLLPGIDDGSPDAATSVSYIKKMMELGYRKFITTPHIYPDLYPNTRATILAAHQRLTEKLNEEGIDVEVHAAAEYFIDDSFLELMEKEELLSFGTKRCVLVEMSFIAPAPQWEEAIFTLITQGYQPILAHPERYTYWHRHPKAFQRVIERGAWLQANISSILGHYGKPIQQVAKTLWKEGHISLLGTDIHHDQHLHLLKRFEKDKEMQKLLSRFPLDNLQLF